MSKRICLLLVTLILCAVYFSSNVSSLDQASQDNWQEYQITFDNADQFAPAIWKDKIVYMDERNDNWDIYLFNLSSGEEKPLVTEVHHQSYPDIYEDKVVYADMRNGNSDIYLYNLSTGVETAICTNLATQWRAHVYADMVIWIDNRSGRWDVYMYNLLAEKEIKVSASSSNYKPSLDIYGDGIVWCDDRNGNWDICLYNITDGEEYQITTDEFDQTCPAIFEDKIVWADNRNATQPIMSNVMPDDIYFYDINTKKEISICENDEHQLFPDIYGNKVVWVDQRNDPMGDIYMYDLSINETLTVCDKAASQLTPKIYGNKIVWQDNRNGNWDIYLYTNESVNIPTHDQQDIQDTQKIQGLLEQYRYILITIIVAVAILIPFIYYRIKMGKLKHEK